ncbi:MAG: hypothetical protein ACQ9ET_00710 [Nitrosomonadaceae bacterium]
MAFGVVGLTPAVFWNMSWKDYELTVRGFFKQKKEDAERELINAKLIGYHAISPHLKKRMSFAEFAGIEKKRVKLPTAEELEYMAKKMGKFIDKNGIGFN